MKKDYIEQNSITISKATEQDIPHLVDMWRDSFFFHYHLDDNDYPDDRFYYYPDQKLNRNNQEFLERTLKKGEREISIARTASREPVGFIMFYIGEADSGSQIGTLDPVRQTRQIGIIEEVYVCESYRSQKTGEKLLEEAERYLFEEKNIPHVKLSVYVTNERAKRFYERLGYRIRVENYYKKRSPLPITSSSLVSA